MTTQGYTILESPEPRQTLIHVHPDADELGRVFRPTLGDPVRAGRLRAAADDDGAARRRALGDMDGSRRAPIISRRWSRTPYNGALDVGRAMMRDCATGCPTTRSSRSMPAITPAGRSAIWLRPARPPVGPTSGAMGYSVPAAVAASLVHPDRLVIGFVGDGGFMMCGQEIATAVQHGGKPIIIVFNNRMYGTIRMHQEREHPERVVGTDLNAPRFRGDGPRPGLPWRDGDAHRRFRCRPSNARSNPARRR